jgi:phenylpropionate dioxygenase-like ring-hydroxylating dioxygenase large terminal subunit
MLTAEQNRTLTRTGPDTEMGRVFRCYWQPALLSRELEADGAPQRIRLMGEDFVAFRDSAGRVGVLEPGCSHRGASLFFGRNEHQGLRCVYHGWKFNTAGECVDMPTASPEVAARMQPRATIRALPVRESGDLIWVFLGDGEPPELPDFEFASLPPEHRFVSKKFQQCNWAQAVEGGLDTAHFSYLHANIENGQRRSLVPGDGVNEPPAIARFRWLIEDSQPQFTVLRHDAGLLLGASRQADAGQIYWRLTQFLLPNHSLVPNTFPGENYQGNTWVPVDDENCWIYCFVWNPERPLSAEERDRFDAGSGIFAAVDENFVPIRNRDNDYLLDRSRQRYSNFTGIQGISEQDAAIADSQGRIADRTRELLGQTDLGIVRFRQIMLEAASRVASGERPSGADAGAAYRLRSGDAMADPDTPLVDVAAQRFAEMAGRSLAAF